jgi:hypothetical protein
MSTGTILTLDAHDLYGDPRVLTTDDVIAVSDTLEALWCGADRRDEQ